MVQNIAAGEIRSHLFTCQVWMLRGEGIVVVLLFGFPTAFMQKPHGEKPRAGFSIKVLSMISMKYGGYAICH